MMAIDRKRMNTRPLHALLTAMLLIGVITLLQACQGGEPVAETAAGRAVDASAAGLVIEDLPAIFEVATGDGATLEFAAPSQPGPSRMVVALGARQEGGLNLIDAVQQVLDNYESLPEGQQFGQTQLMAPIGLTYMARGRYQQDGAAVEELKAMLVHPWGNRLLSLTYTYPAGADTADRGGQLMELLGSMEPATDPAAEPATAED